MKSARVLREYLSTATLNFSDIPQPPIWVSNDRMKETQSLLSRNKKVDLLSVLPTYPMVPIDGKVCLLD
jgi:hypothetical protein